MKQCCYSGLGLSQLEHTFHDPQKVEKNGYQIAQTLKTTVFRVLIEPEISPFFVNIIQQKVLYHLLS